MPLINARAPFVRNGVSVSSMMGEVSAALLLLLILPVARYGIRPLVMAGAAVLTCAVCEIMFGLIQTKGIFIENGSFAVTGLVITMLMPLNAPLWLPCAAAAFAVLVAKGPFGSFGRNGFNPAAAGVAFATLCWPEKVFAYFDPAKPFVLPAFGNCTFETAQSPAAVLKSGLKPDILPFDMLWGNGVGAIGTTCVLVIGACGLFLFLRRTAKWETTVSFLAAAALIAAAFPRIACSPLTSVKYELLSGSLFFGSVFMATDPVTSPHTALGRCLYGAFAGAMLMAFRRFGAFEQGLCFAVLLADAGAGLIDDAAVRVRELEGKLLEK